MLLSLLVFTLTASAQSPFQTVYGKDNRKDLYEIQSSKIRTASEAVTALIYAPKLTEQANDYLIDVKSYEKRFGMCPDVRFAKQPSAPFATGFLVGPRLIMTAGHTVINKPSEQIVDEILCNDVKFIFGYALSKKNQDLSAVSKVQVYSCKKVLKREITWMDKDYALIELDRDVVGIKPLEFAKRELIKPGTSVITIGHPHGLPMKFSSSATIRKIDRNRFSMNTDTSAGNSGSPIFDLESMQVLGIHVSGEYDFDKSRGCKRPYKCPDNECWGSWGYRPDQGFLDSLPQYFSKN